MELNKEDMETLPITLIVKAPNQQIEDQTIKCELSWTINKLKQHLSEVYPSKPVSIPFKHRPSTYITQFSAQTRTKIDLFRPTTKWLSDTKRYLTTIWRPGNSHRASSLYPKALKSTQTGNETAPATSNDRPSAPSHPNQQLDRTECS